MTIPPRHAHRPPSSTELSPRRWLWAVSCWQWKLTRILIYTLPSANSKTSYSALLVRLSLCTWRRTVRTSMETLYNLERWKNKEQAVGRQKQPTDKKSSNLEFTTANTRNCSNLPGRANQGDIINFGAYKHRAEFIPLGELINLVGIPTRVFSSWMSFQLPVPIEDILLPWGKQW